MKISHGKIEIVKCCIKIFTPDINDANRDIGHVTVCINDVTACIDDARADIYDVGQNKGHVIARINDVLNRIDDVSLDNGLAKPYGFNKTL
jgi:hypothetical protein